MTFVVQRWDECARAPGMQCVSVGPAALIDASEQLNCKYLNKHVFSVFFIRAMTVGMPLQCLWEPSIKWGTNSWQDILGLCKQTLFHRGRD